MGLNENENKKGETNLALNNLLNCVKIKHMQMFCSCLGLLWLSFKSFCFIARDSLQITTRPDDIWEGGHANIQTRPKVRAQPAGI